MAEITAPMSGKMWKILVKVGDAVSEDDEVAILEAMKMEIPVGNARIRNHSGNQGERRRRRRSRGLDYGPGIASNGPRAFSENIEK